MLAKGSQLPPILHFLQFKDDPTPRPPGNCVDLCRIWSRQGKARQGKAITGPMV
ncbi:hypothetical protein F4820DRAFT_422876, partial [Hypoxylon rubiginosum]